MGNIFSNFSAWFNRLFGFTSGYPTRAFPSLPQTLQRLTVAYGQGKYTQEGKSCSGRIFLSKDKLYLNGPKGEITQTFLPVAQIVELRQESNALILDVYLNTLSGYHAVIEGERDKLDELRAEIVRRRGFKKRFMQATWYDPHFT